MENLLVPKFEAVEKDLTKRSILIIDDDDSMSDVLSLSLSRLGFETLTAACGREGLQLAKKWRPHLVLLDLCLPDLDGFSICHKLVDDLETCDIPVIILSAMERPDIIRRCRAVGCQYYVRKPCDPNALLILIQQALGEWDGSTQP